MIRFAESFEVSGVPAATRRVRSSVARARCRGHAVGTIVVGLSGIIDDMRHTTDAYDRREGAELDAR